MYLYYTAPNCSLNQLVKNRKKNIFGISLRLLSEHSSNHSLSQKFKKWGDVFQMTVQSLLCTHTQKKIIIWFGLSMLWQWLIREFKMPWQIGHFHNPIIVLSQNTAMNLINGNIYLCSFHTLDVLYSGPKQFHKRGYNQWFNTYKQITHKKSLYQITISMYIFK